MAFEHVVDSDHEGIGQLSRVKDIGLATFIGGKAVIDVRVRDMDSASCAKGGMSEFTIVLR